MVEFFVVIFFGLLLGWFVFPAPAIIVHLKDVLVEKYPGLRPYLRDAK